VENHHPKSVEIKKFGIIDKLKIWVRSKIMTKQLYIVQLDTTDTNVRLVSVKKGLLNTYTVLATDEFDARQVVLRIYKKDVQDQIRGSMYVYPASEIQSNLERIDTAGGLPFWSFLPLDGQRPPKQNDGTSNVSTNSGNKTLDPSIAPTPQPQQQRPRPQQQPQRPQQPNRVDVGRVTKGSRNSEFHEGDESRPSTPDNLSPDKAKLIRQLGVNKSSDVQDEGVNNRINSSTGVNQNLTRTRQAETTPNTMKPNQAQLLSKLGIAAPQNELDPIYDADVAQPAEAFNDPSLSEIDNKVLSEADLKRMASELEDHK
jgi:hypothetical protein